VAERTADELALLVRELLALVGLSPVSVDGVAVSSSVPAVTGTVAQMVERWFPVPLVVASAATTSWLPVRYDSPADVGPDRLVDAIGALDLAPGPLVVVDLGTATTINAVSAAGEYLGGAIVPGIGISLDALYAHAAALRRVELVAPQRAVGSSTVESLRSGVVLGYASLVDGMCRRFQAEIGEATVVATGGIAPLVVGHCAEVDRHEPWLTLHGLRIVYERELSRRGVVA
jgi:type III pantothenate kinase